MNHILYCILILVSLLSSCTRDQDPTDLANSLTGKYLHVETKRILGYNLEHSVEWTISRTSENTVSLKHHITEKLIGVNLDGYVPSQPFSETIPDIEISKSGILEIDRIVDFAFDRSKEQTRWIVKGASNGRNMNVDITQITIADNDSVSRKLAFKKQ